MDLIIFQTYLNTVIIGYTDIHVDKEIYQEIIHKLQWRPAPRYGHQWITFGVILDLAATA